MKWSINLTNIQHDDITKKIKPFLQGEKIKKIRDIVFQSIVLAIMASLLTAGISNVITRCQIRKEQLRLLSSIYIGTNKEWMDESFGVAQFAGEMDDYHLAAYTSEFYIIQVAYDQKDSVQAYLVTALDNDKHIKVRIKDMTMYDYKKIILGKTPYYGAIYEPERLYGFCTNGTGRLLYSEEFWSNGGGNYYDYYLATLDYGVIREHRLLGKDYWVDEYLDDEITNSEIYDDILIAKVDRKHSAPNSYGVGNIGDLYYDIMFSYEWFNSLALRNKYNP